MMSDRGLLGRASALVRNLVQVVAVLLTLVACAPTAARTTAAKPATSPTATAGTPTPSAQQDANGQRINSLVGAYFFYWYDCPRTNCDTTQMVYTPTYLNEYSNKDQQWYIDEFTDMTKAGVNYVIPISWGTGYPDVSYFDDKETVPLMVQAISQHALPLKIAMFDDTDSEVAEWNYDNGRGYINPTTNSSAQRMPLSNSANWKYFYDLHIKPFYRLVPRSLWATADGKSVDEGGRPIILVYDAGRSFTAVGAGAQLWQAVKTAFARDFVNAHGQGIVPFIVLDDSWFDPSLNPQAAALRQVADAMFQWNGGGVDVTPRQTLNGYTTTSITPGFVCPNQSQYATGHACGSLQLRRDYDFFTGTAGRDGDGLRTMFQKYVPTSNLVLVETWNELWEGTGIERSDAYPSASGTSDLPNDYYISLLHSLVFSASLPSTATVERLLNPTTDDYLYTTDQAEIGSAQQHGYTLDGPAFGAYTSQAPGTKPVYRLHDSGTSHFYTISASEKDALINTQRYTLEGIAFYAYATQQPKTTPVFRLRTPKGTHFYTASPDERDTAISKNGFTDEGIAFYVPAE